MEEHDKSQLDALLGLGEQSFRKSYYPELQNTIAQLEHEREKFRTIFNHSIQLIGLMDVNGILLEANNRALDFIGGRAEDVIGQYFWDTPWWVGNQEAIAMLKASMALALDGQTPRFEASHPGRNGHGRITVEFTITPLRDAQGKVVMLIPEGRDITSRKVAEAEKIASLGQLVAGISHEINTPLGISYTGVSYLREKIETAISQTPGDISAILKELLDVSILVERNIERTASLVRNFKNISVNQIQENRQTINLSRHLEDIIHSSEGLLKPGMHQAILDCPPDITMEGYPAALTQIIRQLMENSVKHGFQDRPAGHIDISARIVAGMLELVYRDNGQGIPEDNRNRIFEPFFTTNRGENAGLGLNMVYNLVCHMFKGDIVLLPTEAPGVHFHITLSLSC